MVLDGTDEVTLNQAVGRIQGTARPGEMGNLGIAGHRDGWFRALKKVIAGGRDLPPHPRWPLPLPRRGDRDRGAQRDRRCSPPPHDARLTLVTCYPFYWMGNAPQRYIVKAQLVDAVR
jgi:sortase A